MRKWIIIDVLVVFFLVSVYAGANIHERLYYVGEGENKMLFTAKHIFLPGYITVYYPEQEVDLRGWVGTRYEDGKNEKENPQIMAGKTLRLLGVFADYELKEKDGHYILYRPEKTEKVFSWKTPYQIWPGKKDNIINK